jgi:hypothetical protein
LLATLEKPIASIAANGSWIAAQSVDGTIYRRGGDKESRTTVDTKTVGIDVSHDGTVYIPRGKQLFAWGPTAGEPVPIVDIGLAITTLRVVTGGRVAMIGTDRSMHVYDPVSRTARLVASGVTGTLGLDLDISQDGTLAATRIDRALAVVQLATSARWTLADRLETQALALSPEGRYLIASDVAGPVLYRFDLTLPPATAAWVKAATNAQPPRSPTAVLEWRPLP